MNIVYSPTLSSVIKIGLYVEFIFKYFYLKGTLMKSVMPQGTKSSTNSGLRGGGAALRDLDRL